MLNDVTKTKQVEEKRIREKALILGKISHEFKNPFIAICETIDDLKETNSNQGTKTQIRDRQNKLSFLGNLCQYMILLIKDFEVISSLENRLNVDIFPSKFPADEFINEVGQIISALLKKKNSREIINLKVSKDASIKTLTTDNLRLKQILINLTSNSIKFTEKGYIELKIEKYMSYQSIYNEDIIETIIPYSYADYQLLCNNNPKIIIKFSILDTGKGLSKEFITNFNNSSLKIQKENSAENTLGTGYGLEIVRNLCKTIGSSIKVENNFPNGSIFYFAIYQDYKDEEDTLSYDDNANNNIFDCDGVEFSETNNPNIISTKNNQFKKKFVSFDDQLIFKDKRTQMTNIQNLENNQIFKSLKTICSVSLNDSDDIKLKSNISIMERNVGKNLKSCLSITTLKNSNLFCDIPKALYDKYKQENIIIQNVDDVPVLERQVDNLREVIPKEANEHLEVNRGINIINNLNK